MVHPRAESKECGLSADVHDVPRDRTLLLSKRSPRPGEKTSTAQAGSQITFVVDAKRRLVAMKAGKRVTPRGLEKYTSLVRADPSFDPSFSEIADLRGAEAIDINADEMIQAADKLDPFSADACRAFVVQSKTLAHAARMHKILRSQRNFEIFYSVEEAEQWIRKQAAQSEVRTKTCRL